MKWKPPKIKSLPFEVSNKAHIWQEHPELGPEAGREFFRLASQVYEKGNARQDEIQRAVQRFPDKAPFYLLAAEMSPFDQQYRVLADLARDFPNTIYGRLAAALIQIKRAEDDPFYTPELQLPPLEGIYPARSKYPALEVYIHRQIHAHILFLQGHTQEAFQYDAQCEQLSAKDTASNLLPLICHKNARFSGAYILSIMVPPPDPWLEYNINETERAKLPALKAIQTNKPSPLQLTQSVELWTRPLKYDPDFFPRLLAAERSLLIADLCTILHDCVKLFDHFHYRLAHPDAPLHALLLLCHLRATEAAPAIHKFLTAFRPMLDFYLGDFMSEELPAWFSLLLLEDIQLLDSLIYDQQADFLSRNIPLAALSAICDNRPELRPTIENHLLILLQQLNGKIAPNDDPYQLELNTQILYICIDAKLHDLHDAIEPYIEANLVDVPDETEWDDPDSLHDRANFHLSEDSEDLFDDDNDNDSYSPPDRLPIPTSIEEMYNMVEP